MFRKVRTEHITVPAHFDYLSELREFMTRAGKKYRLPQNIVKSFKLAIDEAATNVIRHAYRDEEENGSLKVRLVVRRESVTVCVVDQGKYFDPGRVKDPNLGRYVNMGKRGGLGIFLMRKIMDDIEYKATAEGNELRLTKKRENHPVSRIGNLIPTSFKSLSAQLKAGFWARASGVIALLITAGYLYTFFQVPGQILDREKPHWQAVGRQIISTIERDPTILEDFSGLRQSALLNSHLLQDELFEIALVDSSDWIHGHSNHDSSFATYITPPAGNQRQAGPRLTLYATAIDSAGTREAIYDYTIPFPRGVSSGTPLVVHLRIYKSHVSRMVAAERWANLLFALTVFGIAVAGAFLLIYLIVAPVKKLVEFVRSGGEAQIEANLEIDTSSEVGEIAKAFSDITAKFRESQKNLAEQERLQQEMQVAKEIQQTLLPHEFPELEGFEIAGHYEAAQLVGGDYYDFVEIDRDTLGIVVADVSGKGVPGSMVMTMIRQALRTEARGNKNAADVLARLNDLVVGDMRKGMFVTIFYVIIDSKRRRLNFASAGHNPMILYRGSTAKTYYLNPRGFPIGLELAEEDLFRKYIESDTIQLVEGDLVVLYTDGITEAMNSKRSLYGEERLLRMLHADDWQGAAPFVERLSNDISEFTDGFPQSDDITFVTVHEKTSLQKEEFRRAKEAYRMIMGGTSIRDACTSAGLSTFMYYNKYKKSFDEEGVEGFEIDSETSLEAKHISIEDKSRLFDIIRNHPEYGAKRLSDELNSEKYAFTEINEYKIYDELVRNRLNTRQLREAFVARGGTRGRRPALKPPGTPMLTLDGRVIIEGEAQLLERARRRLTPVERARHDRQEQEADRQKPPVKGQVEEGENVTVAAEPNASEVAPAADQVTQKQIETPPDQPEVEPELETDDRLHMLDEADEAKGIFAIDELIREEIDRSFGEPPTRVDREEEEPAEETTSADPDDESVDDMPVARTAFRDTDFMIAAVDELLNEDALDTTTITFDGSVDLFPPPTRLDHDHRKKATSGPDKIAEDNVRSETARRKALYRREQLMSEGYRSYKAHDFKTAVATFEKVAELYPDHIPALKILGNAYFRSAEYERAVEIYTDVKRRAPADLAVRENSALAMLKLGEYQSAIEEWQSILKSAPERGDIREKLEYFRYKIKEMSQR